MTIPTHLIEKALCLCDKKPYDMSEITWCYYYGEETEFSIEKFSYFLLSENFIYAYINATVQRGKTVVPDYYSMEFLRAIRQNESGNSGPLIDLLTKIPGSLPTS